MKLVNDVLIGTWIKTIWRNTKDNICETIVNSCHSLTHKQAQYSVWIVLCSPAMIVRCVAKKFKLEVIWTTTQLGGILWRHKKKNHRHMIIQNNLCNPAMIVWCVEKKLIIKVIWKTTRNHTIGTWIKKTWRNTKHQVWCMWNYSKQSP